uniref:protein-tyrosine-phosphatase n=1 Tax=Acrobeloides nanus TaxID=290746 RepID=A0A914EGG8_9BILA
MLLLLQVSTSVGQTFVDFPTIQPHLSADSTLLNDLQLQDVMRTLRRMKRSVPKTTSCAIMRQNQTDPRSRFRTSPIRACCPFRRSSRRRLPEIQPILVVDEFGVPLDRNTPFDRNAPDDRSYDNRNLDRNYRSYNDAPSSYKNDSLHRRRGPRRVNYCPILVTSPPIPPPLAGSCHTSESGREICYPKYEELDTSCTDVSGGQKHGLVAPPVIPHATVQAMAFVPPDNLRRLIRQFYRQQGQSVPKDMKFTLKSFLFVKYHCEFGYELVDEIDTMFCQNKQWVLTEPVCRGKGLCEVNNGGCSHSCLSFDNRTVECRCPKGMILDTDKKTCIKPIPKNLCRDLAGCSCSSIDDVQYSCTCLQGEKCLLLKGPPKIYLDPPPPHEILPGGNLNVTCRAVAYPFPQIYWQRENEEVHRTPPKPGTVKSEQILMIRELFHSTTFTCHADNDLGSTQRSIHVVVKGITFN